jgi:hypothetical protein
MADYPSPSTTKRSSAVKIMLHPDMAKKLRVLAEQLGQTPATLASIAVSQYVAQQTVALGATERVVEGFFDHIAPEILSALQNLLGGFTKTPQLENFEKQHKNASFFDADQQEPDFRKGLSASEALADALKKSAALLKAEENIR